MVCIITMYYGKGEFMWFSGTEWEVEVVLSHVNGEGAKLWSRGGDSEMQQCYIRKNIKAATKELPLFDILEVLKLVILVCIEFGNIKHQKNVKYSNNHACCLEKLLWRVPHYWYFKRLVIETTARWVISKNIHSDWFQPIWIMPESIISVGLGMLDLIFLSLTTLQIKINSIDYIPLVTVGAPTLCLQDPY